MTGVQTCALPISIEFLLLQRAGFACGREQSPANWQAQDLVTADVVYEGGKEDYRNITIGGKPFKKSMEETGGAWSTGEFGTILINLFNPGTAAQFHFRQDSLPGMVR